MSDVYATDMMAGLVSDCELNLVRNGYSISLTGPEVWQVEEWGDAMVKPHVPQYLAALQIFIAFFLKGKTWIHLGAEMQAGKTGVVNALTRLIHSNIGKLNIWPQHIFTITGMSDNAWKKQTKERMMPNLRTNVEHNPNLTRIAGEIRKLHGRTGELKNILIVHDESHIAPLAKNRPISIVVNTVKELCPVKDWAKNNIRFLTISATDPARVLEISESDRRDCEVVRLQTTSVYQSVEKLKHAGRVVYIEDDVNSEWGLEKIREMIDGRFEQRPMYHILRPKAKNLDECIKRLRETFPGAFVQLYDAETKATKKKRDDQTTSSVDMDDINNVLREKPEKTTFIILKNMFYAAKTLDDTHVGIMYDRIGGKDDTNLQSLLGRACGYGKSERTVVFTSKQTVENYLAFWKELCSEKGIPEKLTSISTGDINGKMARMHAHTEEGRTVVKPTGPSLVSEASDDDEEMPNTRVDENDFEAIWEEFKTFNEAKKYAGRIREPLKNDEGFYLTAVYFTGSTAKKGVQDYHVVNQYKHNKKTAGLRTQGMKVGDVRHRLIVAYKDTIDRSSNVFIVRGIRRIK